MRNDPRIERLLEEVVASGRSPEDVCRECADLLPDVVERLRHVRGVEAEVGAMFPAAGPPPGAAGEFGAPADATLPEVPGHSVLGVLGHGGMGVVYKARHLKLDRIVAVKMLLAGGFAAPSELARFLREAQAIAALRHAHIVQVYDVGDLGGRPYFTMEYVEGGTLAQKLAEAPQPARQAALMLAMLADAVQVAHAGGIIHRDLKPANILLAADGAPKISDFGLARRYDQGSDLTLGGTRLGTPSYMSPEQAIGREGTIGPSTDIYSLGAVLYEMLTGRPPFRAETPAETERQVIAEDPAPPSRLNAKVPRDLETICLTCLSKEPQRRYSSAAALAEDLRRFLRGEPIAARRAGPPERVLKWMRRKPAQAALLALSCVVALGLLGGGAWAVAHASETARTVGAYAIEIERLQRLERWDEARAVVERAKARLGGAGHASLRTRVDKAEQELALVGRLDLTRRKQLISDSEGLDRIAVCEAADREYDALFREAGLIVSHDESPAVVGERVRSSAIRGVLVEALDDWSQCIVDEHGYERRAWVMAIARAADPDPTGWRERARQPDAWYDITRLANLADTMPAGERSLALPLALGERLGALGGDAVRFLRRIQAAHPSDFWANHAIGWALRRNSPEEALGYFRAQVAARPEAVEGRANLGLVLGMLGEMEESEMQLREALRLEPSHSTARANLGFLLLLTGRESEALPEFARVSRARPDDVNTRLNLGGALEGLGRFAEAASEFRTALRLSPGLGGASNGVTRCESMERLAGWLESVLKGEESPSGPGEKALFASLCRVRGRNADASRLYSEAFAADPSLAEDLSQEFRYQAACAAALAGRGIDAGSPALAPGELAEYREKARQWLASDASVMRGRIEERKDLERVRNAVLRCLSDPALAGIRDAAYLGMLPADEQERCRTLWARFRELQRLLRS